MTNEEAGPSAEWKPPAPPWLDEDGWFLTPVCAATHAVLVQGGFSDPWTEAHRMLKDGGVLAERAQAWLDAEAS